MITKLAKKEVMSLLAKNLLPYFLFILTACGVVFSCAKKTELGNQVSLKLISFPGGSGGIGFDDLGFAPTLRKILVPGGRTGNLYLVDPLSYEVTFINGFSSQKEYRGGHGEGITSADEGNGFIFVTDRTAKVLNAVDPILRKIVTSVPLASSPDYIRYISLTHELWVTEPDDERIEIFILTSSNPPVLTHSTFVSVPGGPESLIYDVLRQRAYTHLWAGKTVALDIKSKKLLNEWPNGCYGSRGIALDAKSGFLFAGCSEGKASTLDLNHEGKIVATLNVGLGIDVISYNSHLKHLYLPGSKSAILSIAKVSEKGQLKLAGQLSIERHSHCTTSDDWENIWVCDPDHGQVLVFKDNGN